MPLGPGHGAVFVELVAGAVHVLGTRGDEVRTELAERFQHHLIVADGLLLVARGVVELAGEPEVLFEGLRQLPQVDVPEQELNIFIVR